MCFAQNLTGTVYPFATVFTWDLKERSERFFSPGRQKDESAGPPEVSPSLYNRREPL
jgi:hypothetical protein